MSEQFPFDPSERYFRAGEIPGKKLLEPNQENIVGMVRTAREVVGGYGHVAIIIPGPAESPRQLLQFVRCDGETQAVLWFKHLEEAQPHEHALTHGIVDEHGRFLVYEAETLFTSVDHNGNHVAQEAMIEFLGLSRLIINESYLGIKREDVFHYASPEEFTRFHGYITQLRSDLYI